MANHVLLFTHEIVRKLATGDFITLPYSITLIPTAVRFQAGAVMGFSLITTASRPALGPTQPPNR